MGFSVSGATVILFLGIFISFGMAYTAASNGAELVGDSYDQKTDDALTRQNTAISIANANVANTGSGLYLNVTVNNTGSTTLSVNDTDILIDGAYTAHDDMEALDVDGNAETDLWLPGETLHFNVSVASEPVRAKVVTGPGVSVTTTAGVN